VITIENLTIKYEDLVAVRSLNLQIDSGWVFGLIGPNGAGKTSVIRCLAGLLVADEGRCTVDGVAVGENPVAVRRRLGYMPDFFGVYDNLRVCEYLEFFGQLYELGPARLRRRTDEVLELTDLTVKRDALVGGLSRGMKQRLCLARAMLHEPGTLLLDEPASGVDPGGRYELRQIIRRLGEAGKTVLVSSHILPELADICDSIGIMESGRLLASGPLAEVSAALGSRNTLTLRILDNRAADAPAFLAGMEAAGDVQVRGDEVEMQLPDNGEAVAEVLTRLVTGGLRIAHVHQEENELERLYLRLTHGELA
jgi:ABC-2 type transport system ATP-binding protein